jgi:hypothetical protein
LQVLKTFDNYFNANIVLSKMQNEGVPCFLRDEFTVTIDPILSNAIGGIKLVVPYEHVYKAKKVLGELEQEYWANAVCTNCKASGLELVVAQTPKNILFSIATWIMGSRATPIKYVYKCEHCATVYERLPALPQEN